MTTFRGDTRYYGCCGALTVPRGKHMSSPNSRDITRWIEQASAISHQPERPRPRGCRMRATSAKRPAHPNHLNPSRS